jgi:hypothetical protein
LRGNRDSVEQAASRYVHPRGSARAMAVPVRRPFQQGSTGIVSGPAVSASSFSVKLQHALMLGVSGGSRHTA